ncbi:response regulator transcription factor [bacterium]|nr:response regulator transcription factor [bacterium]
MKILVVEDETRIAQFIEMGLREQGWQVDVQHRGDEAMAALQNRVYDLAILDIMLPGRDGLSILRQLREQANHVPVILLTARTTLNERIEGLQLGADDYVTKPFYVEELIARIQAVMRRSSGHEQSQRQVGPLVLNLPRREVRVNGREIEMTAREFNLLEYLTRSPGRVYTRTQILERVWDLHFDPSTNIVDVYIQRLRKKIGPEESLIETVRGVGYRIRTDAAEELPQ